MSNKLKINSKDFLRFNQSLISTDYLLNNSNGLIVISPNSLNPSEPTFKYYKGSNKFDYNSNNLNEFILNLYNFLNNNKPNNLSLTKNDFEYSQFINDRYTFIFCEGNYENIILYLNYYTSFYGINMKTVILNNSSIIIPSFVPDPTLGALDNFWRSLENMTINVNPDTNIIPRTDKIPANNNFKWCVSQASPLRNVIINVKPSTPEIWFFDLGWFGSKSQATINSVYASGGYASNIQTNGIINLGGQQQFCFNNIDNSQPFTNISSWSTVMSDSPKTDLTQYRDNGGKNLSLACQVDNNKSINKPLLYFSDINDKKTYKIIIPTKSGIDRILSSDNIFICIPNLTKTSDINFALSNDKVIVLTPGFFELEDSIIISKSNSVIISLGMTTIQNTENKPALIINSNIDNVIISGLFIQANEKSNLLKSCLVEIGNSNFNNFNNFNDTDNFSVYLYDVFIRIGASNGGDSFGPIKSQGCGIKSAVNINLNDVIIENMWIWRADHNNTIRDGLGPDNAYCENALIVNGNNITIYGLACEHTLKDQVIWNGNNGIVSFYQCELPYDAHVNNSGLWSDSESSKIGYSGFIINGDNFNGYGMGIYSYFIKSNIHNYNPNNNTRCNQAILINKKVKSVSLTNAFTIFLNDEQGQGEITNVINDLSCSKLIGSKSDSSNKGVPQWAILNGQQSVYRG
jgi:hypothetical protein